MSIKVSKLSSTYKTGPNKGKTILSRNLSSTENGYSLLVVKTTGSKKWAVVFSSTEVVAELSFNDAMKAARFVLETCKKPQINEMRSAASSVVKS